MQKKLCCMILAAALIASALCSCGGADTADRSGKPLIVCTVFPAYDFARQVLGGTDNFELMMLLKPGSEVHSYEPSPKDIINIKRCDVFVYTGGESDEWVRNILGSIDTSEIEVVSMTDCVDALREEIVEGMEEEPGEKDDGPAYDEHVWTSPVNAQKITRAICGAIARKDESGRAVYEENAENYIAALGELDAKFRETVRNGKRDTIVFGDRFPIRYFTEEYGLTYYAAFPGCSAETEADAGTVAFLIDKVRDEQIPVVFYPEMSNKKVAVTICESSGAEPMRFNSCHNLTADEFESGATYISLMSENLEALKTALN